MTDHPPLDFAYEAYSLIERGAARALTLVERRALLVRGSSGGFTPSTPSEYGRRIAQAWRAQAPFDRSQLFTRRLALDGLDEATLLTLLEADARSSEPNPDWLSAWQSAFDTSKQAAQDSTYFRIFGNDYPLLRPLEPLLAVFIERARNELHAIARTCEHCLVDLPRTISALAAHISSLVIPKIMRTWVLELNVARLDQRLEGDTAQARFRHFLSQLAQPGEIATLLCEYPVLARRLVETLESWLGYCIELLQHLARDWTELISSFPALRDAGPLVAVTPGLGDLHRGGRSVTVFVWSSGMRLVYKPRSLAVDLHFQQLLEWVNIHGFSPALRTLRVVDRGDYGWSEWVESEPADSREAVQQYYRRLGGHLALLYVLEGADFHAENIIAAGSHPMLIDLEGLFHPRVAGSGSDGNTNSDATRLMSQSVLRVGLLPRRMWSQPGAAGLDLSGLGARRDQRSPVVLPTWAGQGTDLMHLAQTRGRIHLSLAHLPRIGNETVEPADFRDEVAMGFEQMYRLLHNHRSPLLEFVHRAFANDPVRCLFRSTHRYSKILFDSYHPDALRDAIERDRVLDLLWVDVERSPRLETVLPAERADLAAGDIPLFLTTPSSCDVRTARRSTIPDVFESPALEHVRQRIAQLGEDDLSRQQWMIDASFATMVPEDARPPRQRLPVPHTPTAATHERLVEQARKIGERLQRLALSDRDEMSWIGIELRASQEWRVCPVGTDLYAGLSGIVFFLAHLGAMLDEAPLTSLAARALTSLRKRVTCHLEGSRRSSAGAFTGIAGYVYLLSHLSSLWRSAEPLREAEQMIPALAALIDADKTFDVMSGTAGGIAALLSMHAVAPESDALAVAVRGGRHLIAHTMPVANGLAWPGPGPACVPLTGFSHGNAGIAWSLLRLFELTGERCFRDTALAALDYERSLFSPEHDNWPDLRGAGREAGFSAQVAWCHGAPGIALSRLDTLSAIDGPTTRAEIASGVRTTIASGLASNHSLCHGALGNLETLSIAAELLDDAAIREEAGRLADLVLASIEAQGPVTGVPCGVETPGLMVGSAGVGYGLLRLAFPKRTPSVLLLQPPRIPVPQVRV